MIGYLDLPSGLSGDMFLGCLVDAGWPVEQLAALPRRLGVHEAVNIAAEPVMREALRATLVSVRCPASHTHRHLHHIAAMIESADLPASVRQRATAVFTRLAHAEAKVHGTSVEKVHFHEVGAVDAIVDIVGVCLGLEELAIKRLHASAVPLGGGWVDTDHGRLPVPAPATLELLTAANAPTVPGPGEGELVTPTGAALLAELADFSRPPQRLARIAHGAGQKTFAWPNVARLWIGEGPAAASYVQLETNIDDMNPQFYADAQERLFAAGALDVWFTPVQMKKNRPGVVLSVLAAADREATLAEIILRHTSSLGVRVRAVSRHEAAREMRTATTPWGPVDVKLKVLHGRIIAVMPEYESCRKLAHEANVPVQQVHEAALAAAQGMVRVSQ